MNRLHRPAYQIALVFLVKLLMFVYFAINFSENWNPVLTSNSIFISSGDTEYYLTPIENLMDGKGYSKSSRERVANDRLVAYAGRMPGFLPIYGPLYFVLGKANARVALIIFQFILGVFAVYFLAASAKLLFKSNAVFWICLGAYSLSSFVSIFDHYGFAESLATSSMIFGFYAFLYGLNSDEKKFFVISGLFLCWSAFLRPVLGLNLLLLAGILAVYTTVPAKTRAVGVFLLLLPMMVFESVWVLRNTSVMHEPVLFEKYTIANSGKYSEQVLAVQNLIVAWGGNIQQWGYETDMQWFFAEDADSRTSDFTDKNFTSYYNFDSLFVLRKIFQRTFNKHLDMTERTFLAHEATSMANRFRRSYIKEKPFRYYFLSRLHLTSNFVFVSTVNYLPLPKLSDMSFVQKAVKGGYLFYYYLIVLFAIIGLLMLMKNQPMGYLALLCSLLPLMQIFLHASWFGFIEHRYFVPVYPFAVLFASYAVWRCNYYFFPVEATSSSAEMESNRS